MDVHANSSILLRFPREIRDQILGEVIFPGEKEPGNLDQDGLGLASTAVRQIFPYDRSKKQKRDVAVLRTCQQLQHEGEAILYGTSSFNLMYHDWSDPIKLSYEFFQELPRRLRQLVQRVERKCYSETYQQSVSLFDWCAFMKFLATECPRLHSLKLWGPGDRLEGHEWVKSCRQDKEWVQAILKIKTLRYFDIPMIPGGCIYEHQPFREGFMPWIRDAMVSHKSEPHRPTVQQQEPPFRFLDLPRELRNMIYRDVVLPFKKRVHVGLRSWYDQTTRDAYNASLSCRQLHFEISSILYSEGIFATEIPKYNRALMVFLKDHHCADNYGPQSLVHNPWPIKHLALAIYHPSAELLDLPWVVKRAGLESLELFIWYETATAMQSDWEERVVEQRAVGLWQGVFQRKQLIAIAHIPHVSVRLGPMTTVHRDCLDWLEQGLRQELLKGETDLRGLEWLYAGLNEDVEEPIPIRWMGNGNFMFAPWSIHNGMNG